MKMHTTNYFDTFIEVADDTKVDYGTKPPSKEKKTIAQRQYELIAQNPYQYTSDDVLFQVFAERNNVSKEAYKLAREKFFSKGQACLRTSPLTRTYGFGIHFDNKGKIALYGMETQPYQSFLNNPRIKKIKSMRAIKK